MAIGVGQGQDKAAAWRVQCGDRSIFGLCQDFQISQAGGPQAKGGKSGLADFADMQKGVGSGAPGKDPAIVLCGNFQTKIVQKRLHGTQVWDLETHKGDVLDLYTGHDGPPK